MSILKESNILSRSGYGKTMLSLSAVSSTDMKLTRSSTTPQSMIKHSNKEVTTRLKRGALLLENIIERR